MLVQDKQISHEDSLYTTEFFDAHRTESYRSAGAISRIVLSLVDVTSVVDVGCGSGTWLRAFAELGVKDILGIDGDYVDRASLDISPEFFIPHDLKEPIRLDRRFDLAVSAEVAEHIPAELARQFIASLVSLSDIVLFSAAIPGQGGVSHLNEQWPQYWEAHFYEHGYVMIDCIRELIWNNPDVASYYSQNMFLCCSKRVLGVSPELTQLARRPVRALVHPAYYDLDPKLRSAWVIFKTALIKAIKRKIGIRVQ